MTLALVSVSPSARGEDLLRGSEVRSWRIGASRVFIEVEPPRIAIHVDERPLLVERARIDGAAIEFRTVSGWHSVRRLKSAHREEVDASESDLERPLVIEAETSGGVTARLRCRWLAAHRALELRWEFTGEEVLAVRDDLVTDPGESFHGVERGSPFILPDVEPPGRAAASRERWILSSRGYALRGRAGPEASVRAFFPDPDSLRIQSRGSSLELVLLAGPPRETLPRILSLSSRAGAAPDAGAGASGTVEAAGLSGATGARSVPPGFWLRLDRLPDLAGRRLLIEELRRCGFPTPALVVQERDAAASLFEAWSGSGGLSGARRRLPPRTTPRRLAGTTDRWSELREAVRRCLDRSLTGHPRWVSVSTQVLEGSHLVKVVEPSTSVRPEGPVPRAADPEFALRLFAVAAMQPLLCVDRDGDAASRFDAGDDVIARARRYLLLQGALSRLAGALSADETEGRLPFWRHVFVEFPDDPVAWEVRDQWLHGPDVMVAPVLSAGVSRQVAYFPEGTWVDVGSEERRRVIRGPKRELIDVPLGEIGLFERRDARWGVRRFLTGASADESSEE